jgi:hypothetical protein
MNCNEQGRRAFIQWFIGVQRRQSTRLYVGLTSLRSCWNRRDYHDSRRQAEGLWEDAVHPEGRPEFCVRDGMVKIGLWWETLGWHEKAAYSCQEEAIK